MLSDFNHKFEKEGLTFEIFDDEDYEIGMNVIVLQDGKDVISAKSDALKKINKICDFILLYSNSPELFRETPGISCYF